MPILIEFFLIIKTFFMKKLNLFIALFCFSLFQILILSCKSDSKKEVSSEESGKSEKVTEPVTPERIVLSLEDNDWMDKINITANGLNTYSNLNINIKNNTSNIIEMNLKSGLYFVNPSASEQNLITIENIENITIQPNSSFSKSITSACTNSSKGVPGGSVGWSKDIAPKDLDKGIAFYNENEELIFSYLKKSNPNRFRSEEDRQAFLQVVIWSYLDNDYDNMITFLTNEVYNGNSNNAKSFLDEVYDVAQEIARLIREIDKEALIAWVKEKSKELVNKTRDRFRLN